ncbi:major facilitator superfamily domain-containing protein [Xylariales sp. PMI_506]|nr:major facilitator superfamily domain-containing protein [Xylariales sp. PMI_506]
MFFQTYTTSRSEIMDNLTTESNSNLSPKSTNVVTEVTPLFQSDTSAFGEDDSSGKSNTNRSPFLNGITVTRFWAIFSVICLTFAISCFDTTIMASTHPTITSYFRSANSASWLSTSFILTSTASQPIMGRLSDTLGRKPPYMVGIVLFSLATVWCALAQSIMSLIFARAACGVGAGMILSMATIITSDMVPIEIRGNYQAYINIIYGVASVMGAATGGMITELLGWRWTFGIQVPVLCICIVVGALVIPNDIGKSKLDQGDTVLETLQKFDYIGSLLLTVIVSVVILGLNLGGNIYPWMHPLVASSLCIAVLLTPVLLFHEHHHPRPIIPLQLFARSPHMNILVANFLLCGVSNAILFNAPLFFRAVLFESASATGFRLIIIFSMSSLTGALTGFLVSWTRRLKWPLMVGSSILLVGTIILTYGFQRGLPSAWYSLALLPSSLGQGFCFPGSIMAILGVSAQEEQAVVTSILVLCRQIGVIIGIAYSSLLLQNSLIRYLDQFVIGPQKDKIILLVRESVAAIIDLEQPYQEQVVQAYVKSLRLTYFSTIVLAAALLLVLIPVKLPRLEKRRT